MSEGAAPPPPPDEAQVPENPEERPHCKCGTDRDSKYCVVDRDYTFLGTLYLLWGGTSVPRKVTFRCVKCDKAFESSTRRSLCRQHVI
jgi:hypothetical protein